MTTNPITPTGISTSHDHSGGGGLESLERM